MKIKIITNPKKDWAIRLEPEVKLFLIGNGHQLVQRNADVTLCIGGDGTILYSHHCRRISGIILGIGSNTSYICQLRHDDWKENIQDILKSKIISIMTLEAVFRGKKYIAINDFVIHATHYRVAPLNVKYGNNDIKFEGDGIIISSPIGSSGYAYSAGGKIQQPTEKMISIVPIAPYMRRFGPLEVVEQKIEISSDIECAFILDGIYISGIKAGETVAIKRGSDMKFFEGVGKYQR